MAITRLQRGPDAAPVATAAAAPAAPAAGATRPSSWGNAGTTAGPAERPAPAVTEQRAAVTALIAPAADHSQAALSAFSQPVQTAAAALAAPLPQPAPAAVVEAPAAPAAKRTRTRKTAAEPAATDAPWGTGDFPEIGAAVIAARAKVVATVFAGAFEIQSVEDGLEISRSLMEFITDG